MTQFPDPRFERMRRYEPNRRPYVEVREADQRYHAQVIGWNNEEVLIQFPATVLEKVSTAEHVMKWVGTENAQRIRRADSIWASAEDDLQWHATKDHRITYRADPWTVYTQELPPVNIHSLDGSSAPHDRQISLDSGSLVKFSGGGQIPSPWSLRCVASGGSLR